MGRDFDTVCHWVEVRHKHDGIYWQLKDGGYKLYDTVLSGLKRRRKVLDLQRQERHWFSISISVSNKGGRDLEAG